MYANEQGDEVMERVLDALRELGVAMWTINERLEAIEAQIGPEADEEPEGLFAESPEGFVFNRPRKRGTE